MSRLILYSDFRPGVSDVVDDCLLQQLSGTPCRIGYIPSDSDLKRRYFAKVEDAYLKIGISNLRYFDLGEEFDPTGIAKLLDCDAIHLSGGDPIQFLAWIRKRNFGEHLKKYLREGGLLVGISAGAMILSKSLGLMAVDHGKQNAKPTPALRLFDFEFFPHFKEDEKTIKVLTQYALTQRTPVYACDDHSGLLVVNGSLRLLGQVTRFGPPS